jgi:hypothetical protein
MIFASILGASWAKNSFSPGVKTMEKAKVVQKSGKNPRKKVGTEAFHLQHQDGTHHIVGVKALHVLLTRDGDGWFAQGLEIDYAASGDNVEHVKSNFGDGLALTVREHLKMFGSIDKLLVVAPPDAWKEYLAASPQSIKQGYTCVQIHELENVKDGESETDDFPFETIQFVNIDLMNKMFHGGQRTVSV